jgi:hypothetical protein
MLRHQHNAIHNSRLHIMAIEDIEHWAAIITDVKLDMSIYSPELYKDRPVTVVLPC